MLAEGEIFKMTGDERKAGCLGSLYRIATSKKWNTDLEDMNKNSDCRLEEYRSHSDKSSYDSQLSKSISNLGNTTELVQAVSKKRLHFKDDVPIKEPTTKL